jgi:hypothetical protein
VVKIENKYHYNPRFKQWVNENEKCLIVLCIYIRQFLNKTYSATGIFFILDKPKLKKENIFALHVTSILKFFYANCFKKGVKRLGNV